MITAIEIIDTAVKIGLGALISGLATYWVTKLNHDKDLEKQAIRRKRELLEQVAASVEHFLNSFRQYYLVSYKGIQQAKANDQQPISLFEEFGTRRSEVMEATNELSTAQSHLLLLGEKVAAQVLIDLARDTETYMRASQSLDTKTELRSLQEMYESVLKTKEQLYSALSSAYKHNEL